MLRTISWCAGLALCVESAAHAGFTGWIMEGGQIGTSEYWMMNIYAHFSEQTDKLVNVANSNITATFQGGFYQSADHPFWNPSNTQNKNTSVDSWVTIDTNPNGNGNAYSGTIGDGNFQNFADYSGTTTYDFSVIENGPHGAGWYTGNPLNNFGLADGGTVLVAHLVFYAPNLEEGAVPAGVVNWGAQLVYSNASGSAFVAGQSTQFQFVPGPCPVLALALAGQLGNRSRRA